MMLHFHRKKKWPYSLHRQRVLALLQARGAQGATTAEICHPSFGGHEGTRRVRELREIGYVIHGIQLPSGYWRYSLEK